MIQYQYDYRSGIGTDIHRLVPERKLILGGIEIPFELGLLGHSDGDAVLREVESGQTLVITRNGTPVLLSMPDGGGSGAAVAGALDPEQGGLGYARDRSADRPPNAPRLPDRPKKGQEMAQKGHKACRSLVRHRPNLVHNPTMAGKVGSARQKRGNWR